MISDSLSAFNLSKLIPNPLEAAHKYCQALRDSIEIEPLSQHGAVCKVTYAKIRLMQ